MVERQSVQPHLSAFCDKTVIALAIFGDKVQKNVIDTVLLLQTVTKLWKIVNVKRKGLEHRSIRKSHPSGNR